MELAFRHFLGRGVSSLEEFRKYFSIVSEQGLNGLVDSLVNSMNTPASSAKKPFPTCAISGKRPKKVPAGVQTASSSASAHRLMGHRNTSPFTPPTASPSLTSTPMAAAMIRSH